MAFEFFAWHFFTARALELEVKFPLSEGDQPRQSRTAVEMEHIFLPAKKHRVESKKPVHH